MVNVIVVVIVAGLVVGACAYIRKSSRKGIKCVGCPYAGGCSSGKRKA